MLEPAAATDGMKPIEGVGLFMTCTAFWSGTRAKLASVAMLDADMLLAGEAGLTADVKGDGDGFRMVGVLPCEDIWRTIAGMRGADTGAEPVVGVASGVDTVELAVAIEMGVGVCRDPELVAAAG